MAVRTSGCCLAGPVSGRKRAPQEAFGVGCLGPARAQGSRQPRCSQNAMVWRCLTALTAFQGDRSQSRAGAMPGTGGKDPALAEWSCVHLPPCLPSQHTHTCKGAVERPPAQLWLCALWDLSVFVVLLLCSVLEWRCSTFQPLFFVP